MSIRKLLPITICSIILTANTVNAAINITPPAPKYWEITINDGVEQSWVAMCNEQLALIPENCIEAFNDYGYKIYATSKNIDAEFFGGKYGAVRGVTDFTNKEIYIEDRESAVETAVLHEFGHFMDRYLDRPSQNEAFEIYQAETNSFTNYYTIDFEYDSYEFYAESFWKYLTDSNGLNECAPQMYQYWDETLPNI